MALFAHGCGGEPDLRCEGCSVVLVSVDTLRADRLGCYGHTRPTSPRIDRLAAESVLFEAAYAPSYHTADSHMSIFTGIHPSVHGVRNAHASRPTRSLPPSLSTLTESLARAGYRTGGFHGGGNVSPPFGFARGFETYVPTPEDFAPALAWLDERAAHPEEPFFLFAHTFRTHDPYLPDPPYDRLWEPDYDGGMFTRRDAFRALTGAGDFARRRALFWDRVDPERAEDRAKLLALYDGAIRQADDELAPLLDRIEAMPQRVLLAFVSDHGEEFFEHGGKLHDDVWEVTLRVPFLLRHPNGHGAGRRVGERVSLVDIAPTLLDAISLPPLDHAHGESLLDRGGRLAVGERPILAEKVLGDSDSPDLSPARLKQALVVRDLKLIARPNGRQLFDLAGDPHEEVDLAASESPAVARLAEALGRRNRLHLELSRLLPRDGTETELDAETVERLRALGYL